MDERRERERVKKPKFHPVITRVKLNPEQAVLQCSCYSAGQRLGTDESPTSSETICYFFPGKQTTSNTFAEPSTAAS